MTETSPASPLPLRERQRREARRLIHEAALDLFEAQGIAATTVQQISDRVGISSRTFFRHFKAKEEAALLSQTRLFESLESLPRLGDDRESAWGALLGILGEAMDAEDSSQHAEYCRIGRLMTEHPEFARVIASRDRDLVERLAEALGEAWPDPDPLVQRFTAETAILLWRTSWQQWGSALLEDRSAAPSEALRLCVGALSRSLPEKLVFSNDSRGRILET